MAYDPGPLPEQWDPDDPRVLFRRIVDDVLTQIETGQLHPHAKLPSARAMAEQYGVGVMTVQRALRELQQLRVTYSIAGKGTFVHPDLADNRTDPELRKIIEDATTLRQIGDYLRQQQAILADTGSTARGKNAAGRQLFDLAQANQNLLDRIAGTVSTTARRR